MTVSTTALTQPEITAAEILTDVADIGVATVLLAHDSVGGFLSAIGSEFGAVGAVGTGVVTLGVGPAGYARVDGWGNLIGDAGSGYWIGRKALEAVMRAHDGRGAKTALHEFVADQFPIIEEAYLELQTDPSRIARIAAFAKPTIELSHSDVIAAEIVDSATTELVISMSAALARAGFSVEESPTVSWNGSIASNRIVLDQLSVKLAGELPNARLVRPAGDPIDGVQMMANLPDEHPLACHISRASTREEPAGPQRAI
jgi:N-acetylglucosamine kinase-like BadF-type ATPase